MTWYFVHFGTLYIDCTSLREPERLAKKACERGVSFPATNDSSTPSTPSHFTSVSILQCNCHFHFSAKLPSVLWLSPCMDTQTMCCLKSISGRDVKGFTVGKGQCSQRWMYCWGKGHSAEEGGEWMNHFQGHCPKPFEATENSQREGREREQGVIRMQADNYMVSADMMLFGERSWVSGGVTIGSEYNG